MKYQKEAVKSILLNEDLIGVVSEGGSEGHGEGDKEETSGRTK